MITRAIFLRLYANKKFEYLGDLGKLLQIFEKYGVDLQTISVGTVEENQKEGSGVRLMTNVHIVYKNLIFWFDGDFRADEIIDVLDEEDEDDPETEENDEG